jgi:2-methylcitrate dehydratase PrpD
MGETEILAQHIVDLKETHIPAKILEEIKILLFDYLGVALGGARTESGKIAAQFSREQGGRREATIIGFGYRVPSASAAFSNAIISHSIELDDVDSLAYFHFSPPIFSAALAVAEKVHASGKELLVALVAGCDLMARLSSAMNPAHRDRGFHTTSACGVFGAAAASARLLRLDKREMVNTLGLAGAQASGVMEFYGTSMQKRFNPGPAAKGGVISALLAKKGFTGAETIIEGDRGFLHAYAGQVDRGKILDRLGQDFPIFIEYKPYSCARPIHNAIDCALELRRKYGVDPSQVSKITVYRHPRWAAYHKINKPRTYHEAQVSLPYAVAVSLVDGKAFLQQYTEEKMKDPLVQKLCQMAEIRTIDGLPRDVSCRIEVVLQDGSQHVSQVDYPKGSIQNPLTAEEKREKFKDLSSGILSQKEQAKIESTVFGIEKLKDVSKLMGLFERKS